MRFSTVPTLTVGMKASILLSDFFTSSAVLPNLPAIKGTKKSFSDFLTQSMVYKWVAMVTICAFNYKCA